MLVKAGIVLGFLSALFFPWPLTVLVALVMTSFEPWLPLALGVFMDTLYYSPDAASLPWFSLGGLILSLGTLFVRSRIKTSMIEA